MLIKVRRCISLGDVTWGNLERYDAITLGVFPPRKKQLKGEN